MEEECKFCGKKFIKKHKRHRFCSLDCKRKYTYLNVKNQYICSNCKKLYFTNTYKRGEIQFCSKKCELEYKYKNSHEIKTCEFCGKEFECIISSSKKLCSTKCQNLWQKYVYNTEDIKEKRREETIERLRSNIIKNQKSKPHIIVENLLKENNIEFISEYRYDSFIIDIFIKNKYFVEIMGDYWHVNPSLDKKKCLTKQQIDCVERDIKKYKFFLEKDIRLLCLWEYDIINNSDKIYEIIKGFIEKDLNESIVHSYNIINNTNIIPISQKLAYTQLGNPEMGNKAQE